MRPAAVCVLIAAMHAGAQQPRFDPSEFTGRTLEGLRLPVGLTEGLISFRAQRADTWTEPGPTLPDGKPGPPVLRMLLTGDVVAKLGSYDITASRACVWLTKLNPTDPEAGPDVWQVFAYLERGGSSTKAAGITVTGDKLPVQGVIRAPGGISLKADRPVISGRPNDPFVAESERALAARLRRQVEGAGPPPESPEELVRRGLPVPPVEARPNTTDQVEEDARRIAEVEKRLAPADLYQPLFAKEGVFSFTTSGDIQIVGGGGTQDNAVILKASPKGGGVNISYWDRQRDRTIQLTAEQAVVFLAPGPLPQELTRIDKDSVRGVYLEGDVVADMQSADGHYTIRSPRVYYSVKDNRAMLVDAVFWTYDQKRGLPLYVRAKTIEQESANQFKATSAKLTNTAFFEPDLSIGASSVTISPRVQDDGDKSVYVDASDVTLRAGGLPFFYWPRITGDPQTIPLRDFRIDGSSGSGTAVKTTWNAYSLLGIDPKSGDTGEVLLDYYFDRGVALGTALGWSNATAKGALFGYLVPYDQGQEVLVTGEKESFNGQTRGIILGEQRAVINDEWTLFGELAYISDPTFVNGYFESQGRNRREFTDSLYLRRLKDNTNFFVQGQTTFNDFIANEYLKQTPGYVVQRYPDMGYTRLADDLLEAYPGLLSYSSEYRVSQMRLRFDEVPANQYGFKKQSQSQALWGINPDQSIADALRAQGYSGDPVSRFDTRQELTMPLAAGPVNITPFVTGRITAYNDDFAEFNNSTDQWYRWWASEGVRFSTELQRVDNDVESRMFDLHRIRHIIQPTVTLWNANTNIDLGELPVYDDSVESIAQGPAMRMAVNQTWQTQRGGPGRWRSVDVFKFNAELVVSNDNIAQESPMGRYFDFRPEYSVLGGTFGTIDGSWQVTEVLGLGGRMIYDFELNQPAQSDVGYILQHTPDFTSYLDVRFVNAEDSTIFLFGAAYELTKKYSVGVDFSYDTDLGSIQTVSGEIRRRYPNVIVGLGLGYNNITSQTSIGFVFQPVGVTRAGQRFDGIGTGPSRTSLGG